VVLFAARRGAATTSRPLRAATAASTTSRCSQRQGEPVFQIGALRRALVACACCSVSKALGQPFRAFCLRTRRWAPTKSSAVEDHLGGLFLSSRIEHRFVYGNSWILVRFRPLLGAASSGTRPWPLRHPASRTGRGTVGRRRVRVRVHSTLVLSRVGRDKTEPHLTQEESGPSSDPRTPRPCCSMKQKRRLR
jgi:hypothetical protein